MAVRISEELCSFYPALLIVAYKRQKVNGGYAMSGRLFFVVQRSPSIYPKMLRHISDIRYPQMRSVRASQLRPGRRSIRMK
jgi:hypothetical protein